MHMHVDNGFCCFREGTFHVGECQAMVCLKRIYYTFKFKPTSPLSSPQVYLVCALQIIT